MANLGTLWFGADIDLANLKQKIQNGNQSILDALKMNYDQQSYQDMVNKLRSELSRETFEIKIKTNIDSARQSVQQALTNVGNAATNGGMTGLNGVRQLTRDILDQREAVRDTQAEVHRLREEWHRMEAMFGKSSQQAIAAKNAYQTAVRDLRTSRYELQGLNIERSRASLAQSEHTQRMREASESARQLTSDHVRLNTTLAGGIHISTQLGSALSSMYSVYAAQQFLSNVVEIGGQLEKQRISMAAILGDSARANELFGQIKDMALQSPFGVVELDQYSKQLAAYGIEQHNLMDMTKRLADISAGAGQDIGRLALALGHVKSATYLTGITLRQFSMNNIPMLKMLADYYTEVEKRAVSTAEVQKRISQRKVSYEDVAEQIKRMTNEGGMFYNMQEKISESVAAKWKNLKDSLDIMYGDMAESKIGDLLKGTAETLMQLTTRWRQLIPVLALAAMWFGVMKVSQFALNRGTAIYSNGLGKLALVSRNLTAAEVQQLAIEEQITRQELLNAVASGRLSVERAELAGTTLGLTREELLYAKSSGKIVPIMAGNAMATSKYSVAQLRAMAGMSRWTIVMKGLSAAAGGLAVSIAKLAFNPWTLGLAAATAALSLWQAQSEETRKAMELNDQLFNRAEEGIRNVRQMMEETGMQYLSPTNDIDSFGRFAGEIVFPKPSEVDLATMQRNMDIWTKFIQEYAATPNVMINSVYATKENGEAVHSLAEQYQLLGEKVTIVMESIPLLKDVGEALAEAMEDSDGGWFDDSLLTDIKDYQDAIKGVKKKAAELVKEHKRETIAALEAARASTVFSDALKDNRVDIQDYASQLFMLYGEVDKFPDAFQKFQEEFHKLTDDNPREITLLDFLGVKTKLNDLEIEFEQTSEKMKASLEARGWDFDNLTQAQVQALTRGLADMMTQAGVSVDEVKRKLTELAKEKWGIIIDDNTANIIAHISAIKEQLNKLVGEEFKIDIDTATNAFDVIQKIREGYKSAKDEMANAEPILLKIGTTAGEVAEMSEKEIDELAQGDEFVKQVLTRVNEANKKINQATKASEQYGFSLTDPTSKGKVFRDKNKKETDEQLKQWKEQLKELENFYSVYKRYADYMSKDDAIEKALTSDVFKGKVLPKNIDDFIAVLNDFKAKVEHELGKNPSTERQSFLTDLLTKIDQKDFEQNFKESFDKAAKEMQDYVARQAEKYSLFKTLMEKTGDENFARLALADGQVWDEAARMFADKLKEVAGDVNIDFSMTDTQAKEMLKGVEGGYDLWKKVVDIITKNYTNSLTKAAEAQEKALTNEQKIAILENKIRDAQKDSTVDHTAEIRQWQEEIEKLKSDMFELLPVYEKIFGDKAYRSFSSIKAAETAAQQLISNATAGQRDKNGRVSYYSSYYMNGDEMVKVTLTRQQLERLKKVIDDFHKDEVKKNPFATLLDDVKSLYKTMKDNESTPEEQTEAWNKFAESIQAAAGIVGDFAGKLGDMFDALGNESMANAMADVEAGIQSVSNIAQGFAQGGVIGGVVAVAGEAVNWVGRIAKSHDRKLDKAIQRSQREVKELQNAYKNLEWEISHQLTAITREQSAEMLHSLEQQQRELEAQMAAEEAKKKSNADAIIDYRQQIEEMRQQIAAFYQDIAKDRYGLDIDSWASDITSAIVDAFAKGEDAAMAFNDTVAEIMKNVVSNIIKINVVKPAMEGLQDFLFGTNGIATTNSAAGVEITADEAIRLAQELQELENVVQSGKNVYDVVADAMRSMGIDMDETSTSTGSSIQGMTEQTADILAGYINAIRADVSVNRQMLVNATQAVQRASVIAETQVTIQRQIAENTARNARAADDIYSLLHRIAPDGTKFRVA